MTRLTFTSTFIVLALLVVGGPAWGAGALYKCSVKDVTTLGADGRLASTSWTRNLLRSWKTITFDEHTGALRIGGTDPYKLKVIQGTSQDNSLMALRTHKGPVAMVLQVLTIKTFMKELPFALFNHPELYTGLCERM